MELTFAVDFDGTVVQQRYPKVGPPVPRALESLREIVEAGHRIVLFTMRGGSYLHDAVDYMRDCGIPLYGINHNPDQATWTTSPKAYANLYIDDSAVGCPLVYTPGVPPYVDWTEVMRQIRPLL